MDKTSKSFQFSLSGNILYHLKILGILSTIALALNFFNIVNSGYFSHDELSIGYSAQGFGQKSLSEIPWFSFFDLQSFHYRPLSFNLWILTSYFFFSYPQVFHLIFALLWLIPGILLYILSLHISGNVLFSSLVFILFFMSPGTVFAIGWLGTFHELLFISFTLLIILGTYWIENRSKKQAIKLWQLSLFYLFLGFLFVLALMSKETSVIIPAIFAVYLLLYRWSKFFFYSFLLTSILSTIYLVVRIKPLFHAQNAYSFKPTFAQALNYLIDYITYPFAFNTLFIAFPSKSLGSIIFFLLHVLMVFLIFLKYPKYSKLYISLYIIPLIPILVIFYWSPHFLVASSIVLSVALSFILCQKEIAYKAIGLVLTILLIIHSFNIQMEHYKRGMLQNRIQTSLYVNIKNYWVSYNKSSIPKIYVNLGADAPSLDILERAVILGGSHIHEINLPVNYIKVGNPPLDNLNPDLQDSLFLQFDKNGYLTQAPAPTSLYEFNQEIFFKKGGNGSNYMVKGWAYPEENSTWTVGNEAELFFRFNQIPKTDLYLTIDYDAFVRKNHPMLMIDVLINQQKFLTWNISEQDKRPANKLIQIPHSLIKDLSSLRLSFKIRNPTSPSLLNEGTDDTKFGLKIYSVTISNSKPQLSVK